jgi:hypothetical protein
MVFVDVGGFLCGDGFGCALLGRHAEDSFSLL